MNKTGFTLAEVLITLGVIGVVAAITLPSFMENVTERINSERQANIAQKITQAMEQMRAHGLLNTQYQSTDAFVDELQKYLKIAKRCDSEHIADCWPTEKVTTADGKEYEVSKAKTGAHLKHKDNKTGNVGLVLADGASLIMTYNEKAGTIDIGTEIKAGPGTGTRELPVGRGKTKEFPYTTSVTGAVDFVMDVNGGKGPNSETINGKYHDIRSFNGAQFANGMVCDFEVEDLCVKNITGYQSSGTTVQAGLSQPNYWQGAINTCNALDGMHLVSRSELTTIYNKNCTKGHATCISDIPTKGEFWTSDIYDSKNA
ncbi:type II secretion system protein, partial [bacterium]|nr:type II secretion system protein [bacterium]